MTRAADAGRLKIIDKAHKPKLVEQVTRLPYAFDDNSRYKVMSKEEMRKKGLKSPDMADVLAFLFLDGVSPIPANEEGVHHGNSDVQSAMSELERVAAEMEAA